MTHATAANRSQFAVALARPSQTAAVLTLLPELLTAYSLPSSYTIAYARENPSQIVAAAAFVPHIISTQWPGFAIHLHVLADYHGLGIGNALLQQLKIDIRYWGVPYLHVTSHVEDSSPTAQFLQRHQFRPSSTMHHFVGDTQATLPMLDKLVSALYRRNRVPSGFALQPLAKANLHSVAKLFMAQFNMPLPIAHHTIQQALADPLTSELSLTLSNGQDLAGFLIAKQGKDFPEVGYWASSANYRQGWPAALLLEGFVRGLQERGIKQGGYACNDKTTATLNVARKTGAQRVAVKSSYVLKLESTT